MGLRGVRVLGAAAAPCPDDVSPGRAFRPSEGVVGLFSLGAWERGSQMTSSLKSALAWSPMWAGVAPPLLEHRCLSWGPPPLSSQTASSISRSKLPTQGGVGVLASVSLPLGPWVWDPGSEEVDGNTLPTHSKMLPTQALDQETTQFFPTSN